MKTILTRAILFITLTVAYVIGGCSGSTPGLVATPEFDARNTLRFIEKQVSFGPRVPGSPAWEECRAYLIAYFDSLGYEVKRHDFTHVDYLTGQTIPLTNMLVTQKDPPKSDEGAILLCAHWDSRPRSERDPDPARRNDSLPGANDGAAGVAMLMQFAALVKATPPKAPIAFALFDGEDWGQEGDNNQYGIGAREFARHISPLEYRFGVLFDIIAHPNARFLREGNSDLYARKITKKIWATAQQMGVSRFVDKTGNPVIDDHLPLLNAGVPTVDIIDMRYKYWHTTADTPDKCDSAALHDVGSVIAQVIYREQ